MANIPVLSEGSEREHATPVAPEPTAPPSAFAGRVGGVVEQVGMEIGQIAQNERQRVAQEQALRAESDYLGYAMDARDKFSELRGQDALAVSEETKQGMYTKLQEIGSTLGSRHARDLYMGSTLRNWRILESQINTHAASQRNALSASTYSNNVAAQAQFLAGYAGDAAAALNRGEADSYKQGDVEGVLQKIQANAYRRAADLGMPEEAAHDFADKSLAVPVDALIGTLARTGHPAARAMFESEWGKHLSPTKVAGIQNAIYGKAVDTKAAEILQNTPTLDFSRQGTPDPDGPKNEAVAYAMVEAAPEELRPALYTAVSKGLEKANVNFERAVKIHAHQVFVDGTEKDPESPDYGKFVGVDRVKSADQIAWMIRSGSNALDKLYEVERKKDKAGAVDDNNESLKLLRANLVKLVGSDPDALQKMGQPELLAEMMRDAYPGFNSSGMRQAGGILREIQQHPRIKLLESVPRHVDDVLGQMFGVGDADLKKVYKDELISELSEAMRNPDFKADDVAISSFIHRAFETRAVPGRWWGTNDRQLIDLRMEMRKAQGGGRLPTRIWKNRAGEVRIYYEGENPNKAPPDATPPSEPGGTGP